MEISVNDLKLTERTQVHGTNGYVQCSKGKNSKSRQTRVTVHAFCTSTHRSLNLCEVSSKYLKRFPTYIADTNTWQKWVFFQYLRCSKGCNSKGRLTSYGSCILHVVSWCFKFVWDFMKISQMVFNLQNGHEYMVEIAMFNIRRAITPKSSKPESGFMCSAFRLMVLYICGSFVKIWTVSVMQQTRVHGRNGYVQCSKGNNSKIRQTRVKFHVFCTSQMVSESWRGHKIMKCWWTDTQNFGQYNIIPCHFLWQGIKMRMLILSYMIQVDVPNVCTKFQNPRCISSWEIFNINFPKHYTWVREGEK